MQIKPVKVGGIDLTGFRFDPLSEAMLGFVDQGFTIKQMIDAVSEGIADVVRTLNVLKDSGLITWSTNHLNAPKNTLQGAPPPWKKSSTEPAPPVDQAAESETPEAPAGPKDEPGGEPIRGVLTDKNPGSLVAAAAETSFTGSLYLKRGVEEVTFYFEQGNPKGVKSTSKQHDYGVMLRKVGLFDENMLNRYRSSLADGAEPIHALKSAGVRDREAMEKIVMWHGRELYRQVLTWTEGTYLLTPNESIPTGVMHCDLKLVKVAAPDWRKEHLIEEQNKFLTDNSMMYMVATDRAEEIASSLNLNNKEKRYVGHVIEGAPMQLRKALTISSLFKAVTRKIVFVLVDKGAFELHETNPELETPIKLEELDTTLVRLENLDHFTVLDAHAVSIEEEIKSRYERQLRRIDPKHFKNARPEQMQTLAKIRERYEKAWRVLGNDETRREYRKSIYTEYQLKNFFELQLEKADAAFTIQADPKTALPLALSAWDLRPGHPTASRIIVNSMKALGKYKEMRKYQVEGIE